MIQTHTIEKKATGDLDIIDLTGEIEKLVKESGVKQGHLVAFVPGSTAALTTIEFEGGVVNDLRKAIERLVPRTITYDHDARWGDGNGYSHVRAAIMGPSLYVPILHGQLTLGTWQQVVLCDFDNRPRTRKIIVQIVGE
ncbi:MAG: secondary thiamine-phosphate synthase enzyme YjbQ [Polyangia bacterium]|nr:secondary thiamine-phosphate synthase enzyme YjbQ [Polyangia bacterium]